jgi:hypothetical protein
VLSLVALLLFIAFAAPVNGQTTNSIVNGGFETGDFTGWILSGDTNDTWIAGAYEYDFPPHSGNFFAFLGTTGSRGYLSQALSTSAGQSFSVSISFWVNNNFGDPNVFLVSWNGTNLYAQTNLVANGWINIHTNMSFTGPPNGASVLQFTFEDDEDYLGLDDVSVVLTPNATPTAGVAYADSLDFALNTGGLQWALGGVAYADSTDFTLNTELPAPPMAGVAYADSGDFTLNTGGTSWALGGVAYADSSDFALNAGGALWVMGGVAYADSGDFTLSTPGGGGRSGPPHLTSISVSGKMLTLTATNGTASTQYELLSTTNVGAPLSQWLKVWTGYFDGSGNLNLATTNVINSAMPQEFFILKE